jgi:hypothetical protein
MIALSLAILLAASPGRGTAVSTPTPMASVGVDGDSMMDGVCGTAVSLHLDAALPAGYVAINNAVSGHTAHQIATRIIANAATACLGEPCGTYVVEGGVNTLKQGIYDEEPDDAVVADIALNGDGAEVLGIMDGVDYLRAQYPNATILAVGVFPYASCTQVVCGTLVRPQARADAYSVAFLAECAARPWLRCANFYSAYEDPENPGNLRPDIACEDGSHMTTAGRVELADDIKAMRTWR